LAAILDGICHLCNLVGVSAVSEYQGNPLVNSILGSEQPNLEGQRLAGQKRRCGQSRLREPCGAVNGMHDSLMPTGGFDSFNLFYRLSGVVRIGLLTYSFT